MEDKIFMSEAIRLSKLAVEHGDEPFGASNIELENIFGNKSCSSSKLVFDNSFWKPKFTGGVLRKEALKILNWYFANHQKG